MSNAEWDHHHAAASHGHNSGTQSPAELAGFLAGSINRPARAIDLGCGTGSDAVFLAEQGIDVIGIDFSATALEQAKRRAAQHGVQVEWLEGDVLDIPLADGSIDLALDRGCLHHLTTNDQRRYAIEVARILKPGGSLLVREMNHAGHHEHAVSEESLQSMLDGTPLRMRSVTTYLDVGSERRLGTMLAVIDRA